MSLKKLITFLTEVFGWTEIQATIDKIAVSKINYLKKKNVEILRSFRHRLATTYTLLEFLLFPCLARIFVVVTRDRDGVKNAEI